MRVAQIQFAPWDKIYYFNPKDLEIEMGNYVIVDTELGQELGKVVGFKELDDNLLVLFEQEDSEAGKDLPEGKIILKPIIRKTNKNDFEKLPGKKERKQALLYCQAMIEKHELDMKLIDICYSFDGTRVTFAFAADSRIDFRELVKDLTRHFNRNIRLYQIGIRDKAKILGDCGHCGLELCCRKFIKEFSSINSNMAETQQVVHRGSDRISGVCGRLMCCLKYEQEGYEELNKRVPEIGQKVNVDGKRGVVVSRNVLKQTVDVEISENNGNGDGKTIIEVDLNRNKK